MIRGLRRLHRGASAAMVVAGGLLVIGVPLLSERPPGALGPVADSARPRSTGPEPGSLMRVVQEGPLGQLQVTLALEPGERGVRVLETAGTTYADVLVYWSESTDGDGLPADARLIAPLETLVREPADLPEGEGVLHFFSLAHGTLAGSLVVGPTD